MRNEIRNVNKHLKNIKSLSGTFEDIFNATFLLNQGKIIFEYDLDGETKYESFSEVKNRIIDVSYSLSSIINSKGNFIALNLDTSPNWIIAFWAILYSGNKPFLVNRRKPNVSNIKSCSYLNIRYSIDEVDNSLNLISIPFSSLNKIHSDDYKPSFANTIALSTSGTSLDEKICIYSGENIVSQIGNSKFLLARCKDIQKTYHMKAKFLVFLPFYHIFGLVSLVFWFSFFGYPLVFLQDYSPNNIFYTIKKHNVTHILAVPLLYHQIEKEIYKELNKDQKLKKKFEKAIRISNHLQSKVPFLGNIFYKTVLKEARNKIFGPSVVFTISGGSFIKKSTLELFNGLGYHLHVGYGSSETGITALDTSQKPVIRNQNSVGVPVKSVNYKLENGVLFVKGKSTCSSMIINGKEFINDEWFNTNDNAIVKNGRYYILGRKDDLLILSDGENINPDQIEALFNFPSNVVNYSLFAFEDSNNLLIQVKKNITNKDLEYIKKYTLDTLENKLIVSIIFTYDDILGNGIKISRKLIAKRMKEKNIKLFTKVDVKEKLDSIEKDVVDIAKEVLNNNEISLNTNFLTDIQITSLDYFMLVSRISEEYDVKLIGPNGMFFYSIKDICNVIRKKINEA